MSRYILLVEDDDDIRMGIIEALEAEAHRVVAVAHGADALAHLATAPPPCLILLDLAMPVMSGAEFLARQRANPALAGVPVAVFSAQSRAEVARAVGAVEVLLKPVDLEALLATVARYC